MGNIRSLNFQQTKGKIGVMRKALRRGYHYVMLRWNTENGKQHSVHRLVCSAFLGVDSRQVNHINGVKTDNRLLNLEYCTQSENMKHCFRIGLQSNHGERHSQAKLTDDIVISIRGRVKAEESMTAIARELQIHPSNVSRICSGQYWRENFQKYETAK